MKKVQDYIKAENWKKAFSTARKFFFGLSKDELRDIEIASDYLNGKELFYKALGIDCEFHFNNAKSILIKKYFS